MQNKSSYLVYPDLQGPINAWEVLFREKICTFPILPSRIAKRHGYRLITYEEYSRASGIPVLELASHYGSDGFTQCVNSHVIIVYHACRSPGRIRWTVMHELAHLFLGHIRGDGVISRTSRAYTEHRDQESQADALAANILCPLSIVHQCRCQSSYELRTLTDLSQAASEIRWHELKRAEARGGFRYAGLEREVLIQFFPFIRSYLSQKIYSEPEISIPRSYYNRI